MGTNYYLESEPPCFRPRLSMDKATRKVQLVKLLEECK